MATQIRRLWPGDTKGSAQKMLDIQSITIDGRRYAVSTLAGAPASNRKGTAIDLLIGTADGAASKVPTKGHDLTVPAETVLRFLLDRPLTLSAEE